MSEITIPDEIVNEMKEQFEEEEKKEHGDKIQLPPLPDVLFEIPEEQAKFYAYPDLDKTDKVKRMKHKLWMLWQIYGRIRNNERTIQAVTSLGKDTDRESDVYHVCNELVNCIDALGRILSVTDIVEEIFID